VRQHPDLPSELKRLAWFALDSQEGQEYWAAMELMGRYAAANHALKHFMLEGVLLHELGHHVLQHYKGKRPVRIARTRDHEAAAERFASRQRSLFRAARRLPK
jgi:RNA-splicing ligase RtcB